MKIPRWLRPETKSPRREVQDVIEESKAYFAAEMLAPLKGIGRTLAFGIGGALAASLGIVLCLVGLLRALQTETGTTFAGTWTFVPYFADAVAGVLVAGMAILFGLRRYRKRVENS